MNLDERYEYHGHLRGEPAIITVYEDESGLTCRATVERSNGYKSRTMKGESAWSNVRRWAEDTAIKLMKEDA